MLVGLRSFMISSKYRVYMGSSMIVWSLRWLLLYLYSYKLDGSVTAGIEARFNIELVICVFKTKVLIILQWMVMYLWTLCNMWHVCWIMYDLHCMLAMNRDPSWYSTDYRVYKGSSMTVWLILRLLLYLCSYKLDGSVTAGIGARFNTKLVIWVFKTKVLFY